MKKLLLLFTTLALVNIYMFAQDIALYDLDLNNVNGTDIYIHELHNNEFVVDLLVANSSANAIDVIFKKSYISLDAGITEYFCVGATCFLPSSMESGAMNVAAGGIHPDTCFAHFLPGASTIPSIIRYTIYNAANPEDSASVVVHFNDELSVREANDIVFEMYPNPASEFINVDYKLNDGNNLFTIYNMLGTEVKEIRLSDFAGSTFVNVSDLNSGVYFYSIRQEKDVLKTGRLVIK